MRNPREEGLRLKKKMSQRKVLGLGNPLIDICTNVGKGFLERWNLEPNAAINASEEQLKIFTEIQQYFKVSIELGGCTLNTLRVFQWLSNEIGNTHMATFSGAIGNDSEGENLTRRLKRMGLNCYMELKNKTRTGKTVSLVTQNGNRSLVADISAADKYTLNYFNDHIYNELEHSTGASSELGQAGIIYQSAWFILGNGNFQSAENLAKSAFSQGKDYILNIGGEYICNFHISKLNQIIPYANFLVANASEFIALARSLDWIETDINQIITKIANYNFGVGHARRTVICTQGDKETRVYWARASSGEKIGEKVGDSDQVGDLMYFKTLPIEQNEIIDTTAAGDSFCGGLLFIFSLYNSLSVDIIGEAVECGHYCAREIIKRRGCSLSTRCGYFSWKNGLADLTRRSVG